MEGAGSVASGVPEEYEIVVLGSGEGGKYLAWTMAKQGKRVLVIERKYIGGSCPNIACLPSKNIIHSAKVASYFYRSEEFGISKESVRIDMRAVRERKRLMVAGLVDMHMDNFKSSGAELLIGSARFTGPKTFDVELPDGRARVICGEKVVIGTGTHATLPGNSGAGRSETSHACRSPRTRPHSGAPASARRRLCGAGTRPGFSTLRQSRYSDRSQ